MDGHVVVKGGAADQLEDPDVFREFVFPRGQDDCHEWNGDQSVDSENGMPVMVPRGTDNACGSSTSSSIFYCGLEISTSLSTSCSISASQDSIAPHLL
jgi:hypothetical protein